MTAYRAGDTDIASKNRVGGGMAASKTAQRRPRRARASDPASDGNAAEVDYSALARFRHELRKFQAFSKAAAKTAGLTPQQHQALLAVRGFSNAAPISVGELADFLLIQHHTAVELVDRMTKLELLARVVDDTDGRRVLVKLTREGERRLQKLSQSHLRELRSIGPALARMLETFHNS